MATPLLLQPKALLSVMKNFWGRNNPLEGAIHSVVQGIDFLRNMESQKQLLKYRSMVYLEQLQSIESNLHRGMTAPKGNKVDRFY